MTIDHEFSADGKTLTLKVGETVVATYAVDTSNVVTISADVNVDVADDVTSGTSTVTGDNATAASNAVTDSATKTEGLMESTAAALVEEAQKLAESNKEKIETELGVGTTTPSRWRLRSPSPPPTWSWARVTASSWISSPPTPSPL